MFFVFTSGLSVYGLIYYRRNGSLPGATSSSDPSSIEAQTRDAFSTADHHGDDTTYGGKRTHDDDEDEYALLHSNQNVGGTHSGRPLSWGAEDARDSEAYDTPYHNEYADEHPGRSEVDLDAPYGHVEGHQYTGVHGGAPYPP